MNTTTTQTPTPNTETQTPTEKNKALLSTHQPEKKRSMRSLSLRPSRSVKRNSSLLPHLIKPN